MTLSIVPVPAFEDNYLWVIHNGRHAAVVDPGDAEPVRRYLDAHKLQLAAILVTHHHPDHIGGLAALAANLPVFGPADDRIAGITRRVVQDDVVEVTELAAQFRVLEVPGHTRSHIAYYGASSLFCGDTLFACGCGRLFEGTPEQMTTSFARIAALPDDTLAYCAHEYTLSNIRFARAVEPGNKALEQRAAREEETRRQHKPTVPFTLGLEKTTNPFMRCTAPEVVASATRHAGRELGSPAQVFGAIREWKNNF